MAKKESIYMQAVIVGIDTLHVASEKRLYRDEVNIFEEINGQAQQLVSDGIKAHNVILWDLYINCLIGGGAMTFSSLHMARTIYGLEVVRTEIPEKIEVI